MSASIGFEKRQFTSVSLAGSSTEKSLTEFTKQEKAIVSDELAASAIRVADK
jgi:hypothetical protein